MAARSQRKNPSQASQKPRQRRGQRPRPKKSTVARPVSVQSNVPFHMMPPIHNAGDSVYLDARAPFSLTVDPGETAFVVFSSDGAASTVAYYVKWAAIMGANSTVDLPQLNNLPPDGPTSGRASSLSVTISNTTKTLDQGGLTYCIDLDNRIEMEALNAITVDGMNALVGTLIASKSSEPFNGSHYARSRTFHAHTVDIPVFESFRTWGGAETNLTFQGHWATSAVGPSLIGARCMSTIIFIVKPPPVAQTYEFSPEVTLYTRWSTGNVVHRAMKPQPTVSPAVHKSQHDTLRKFAEHGQKIGGHLGNALKQPLQRAITNAASAAIGNAAANAAARAPAPGLRMIGGRMIQPGLAALEDGVAMIM